MSFSVHNCKRVLIKISGELLAGKDRLGIDLPKVMKLADVISRARGTTKELMLVIGAGNIFRGFSASLKGMDRATADYMGMIATIINSLALQDALEKISVPTRVLTAIHMQEVAEPYIRRRALRHLEKGRVVILAGGTGIPYFTTDTTAALRAAELQAEVILKGTKVDGVYEADPIKHPGARRFKDLSYQEVLAKQLRVMDLTAFTLCKENRIPILVFNLKDPENLVRIFEGDNLGTVIREG